MTDVARVARVSVKTVSRVVNGVASVNPEMAARVAEACAALDYEPNLLAASLRTGGQTSVVGLVVEDLANPFYSAIAAGVGDVADAHESLLVLAGSQGDLDRQSVLVQELSARRVDGLVITPVAGRDARLAVARQRGVAVVAADVAPDGVEVDVVRYDNYGASHAAARAALSRGHRRLGLILPASPPATMTARRAGFLDAVREWGVPLDPDLDVTIRPSSRAARAAIEEMLRRPEPPTAVFCGNNVTTTGVVEHVARPAVVRDHLVTLVAFDDYPLCDVLPNPAIVVSHDPREVGVRAGERLFARIGGSDAGGPVETVVATTMTMYDPEAR